MPGGDRTGPRGRGPMTGWGRGSCTGFGRGMGRGFGPGRGYGFRRGFLADVADERTAAEEKAWLEREARILRSRLDAISRRLSQLAED